MPVWLKAYVIIGYVLKYVHTYTLFHIPLGLFSEINGV